MNNQDSITSNKTDDINSYKNIIKGSSFFGGVQLFNIIINLFRGKFVAVILGPDGMGITALFNTASSTIQKFASLGLNQSFVREIAAAQSLQEKEQMISTSLSLTRITAILGFIIAASLCIPLSRLTFGTPDYAWQFILLGLGIAFSISGAGKLAVLQSLHLIKKISRSSIIGSLTGLCIGVPLYYFLGNKGIVPAIVAIAYSIYLFYSISLKKSFPFSFPPQSFREKISPAKKMILLGIVLMAGDLIATLITYLINLYLRTQGSVDTVGLYQAANSVTYQYAGLVFAALAMDYYPRLSGVAHDNYHLKITVNRQAEIVAWIITPAVCLLILSTPLLIRVLLSDNFHTIIPLMKWMGIGIFLKALAFPMAYITLAKGNKKVFFYLEGIFANSLTLILSCLGFNFFGLIGLGYALVADNIICLIVYFFVNNRLYGYNFSMAASINFVTGSLLVISTFTFSFIPDMAIAYSIMALTSLIAIIWAFLNLKKKFFAKS